MSETVLKVDNLNLTYSKGGPQVLFDISFAVSNKAAMESIIPSFGLSGVVNVELKKGMVDGVESIPVGWFFDMPKGSVSQSQEPLKFTSSKTKTSKVRAGM